MVTSGCNSDNPTWADCYYNDQVVDAGQESETWDPRECSDNEEKQCSVVTWGASISDNAFLADLGNCEPAVEDKETDESDDTTDDEDTDAEDDATNGEDDSAIA